MEEELKEAIGIVEEMLEETKIKNIKILLPVEERALENILNRLEQDERVIEEMAESILWESCGSTTIEEVINAYRKKCG